MPDSPARFSQIKISKPVVSITARDVDAMLDKLRSQRASWATAGRGALPGDRVVAEFSGWKGGRKVIASGRNPVSLVLGSAPLPNKLHKHLIGSRPGDRVRVRIKHRKHDGNAALAGSRVDYEYHVLDVLEASIPPLDKAFARSLGIASGSLKSLRKQVKSTLRHQVDNLVKRSVREQLIDGLLRVCAVPAPAAVQSKAARGAGKQRLAAGSDRAANTPGDAGDSAAQSGRRQALAKIIRQIIREHSICVDQDKVAAAIDAIAAASDNPEETASRYHTDQALFSQVEASVLENQVLEFVLAHARVRETPTSYHKLCPDSGGAGSAAAATLSRQAAELPVIELSADRKCDFCARSCCTYITQKIPSPRTKQDFSHLLWQVSHQQVEAYKDTSGWYLMFRSRCEHLLPNGRCGNYEHRMHVCRQYANSYCEFDAPAEAGFDLNFKDYAALLAYCKQRFPRWEY